MFCFCIWESMYTMKQAAIWMWNCNTKGTATPWNHQTAEIAQHTNATQVHCVRILLWFLQEWNWPSVAWTLGIWTASSQTALTNSAGESSGLLVGCFGFGFESGWGFFMDFLSHYGLFIIFIILSLSLRELEKEKQHRRRGWTWRTVGLFLALLNISHGPQGRDKLQHFCCDCLTQ